MRFYHIDPLLNSHVVLQLYMLQFTISIKLCTIAMFSLLYFPTQVQLSIDLLACHRATFSYMCHRDDIYFPHLISLASNAYTEERRDGGRC